MKKSFSQGRSSNVKYKYVNKKIREAVKSVLNAEGNIEVTKKNIAAYILHGSKPSNRDIIQITDLIKTEITTFRRVGHSAIQSNKKVKWVQAKCVKNSQSEVYEVINYIKRTKIAAQMNKNGPLTNDPGPSKAQ